MWGTLPDWITALATCVLVFAAIRQLRLIAEQVKGLADQIRTSREADENAERRTREWETLKACQHYDFDPVIDGATARIWEQSLNGTDYRAPGVNVRDIICLLNYLDGLATGIEQKLFIEEVIRDHLGSVFDHAVINFVDSGIVDRAGLDHLLAVHARWFRSGAIPGYRSTRPAD